MTDFQFAVLSLVKKIPKGKVTTYRKLAQVLGSPRACRAVGNALNSNPYAYLIASHKKSAIPCHRVVCSNGLIGGYQQGSCVKQKLLEQEGLIIKRKKVVDFNSKLFSF